MWLHTRTKQLPIVLFICIQSTRAQQLPKPCNQSLWEVISSTPALSVEESLGRSSFSGNYTLIRDLYQQTYGNFTAIVPTDSSYGLQPSDTQYFNSFWDEFLWNGTGIGTAGNPVPLNTALREIVRSPKSESLVLYHILRGKWTAQQLLALGTVNSLLGEVLNKSFPLTFTADPGNSSVVNVAGVYGSAGPLSAPIHACNGVLFTTNATLVPTANMSIVPEVSTGVDASEVIDAPFLLAQGFNFSSRAPIPWIPASSLIAGSPLLFSPDPLLAPAPAPSNTSTETPSQEGSGVPVGVVVGVVLAAVVVAVAVVLVGLFIVRRRRRRAGNAILLSNDKDAKQERPSTTPTTNTLHDVIISTTTSNPRSGEPQPQHNTTLLTASSEIIQQLLHDPSNDSNTSWEIPMPEITLDTNPDGSPVKLGRGGFGEVYRGVWCGSIPVAVKHVLTGADQSGDTYKQLAKEIRILRGCRNSNIVQFYGACIGPRKSVGDADQPRPPRTLMLVTEYMPMGDLFAALQGARGAAYRWNNKGRFIALDVARGLTYLHARRIAHFDLKSPNILLSSNHTAKIADMGMSRTLAKDVVTKSTTIGTLAWAAPELLINTRISSAVDVYSFGVVLWELVTGLVPMRGRMRSLRPNVDCPEAVVQLYLDCTALEAEDRPTAQQLYSRLHAIVMGTDDVQPTHAGGGDGGDHAGAGDHAGGSHATSAAQGAASGHEKTQHTAAHTRGTESADAQGAPRTHGHVPHAGDTGDASVFAHDHALLSASTTVFFADDDSDTA